MVSEITGVMMAFAGVIVIAVALAGRTGRLRRNHWVGIRLPSTLRSDSAWDAAHRSTWAYVVVSGLFLTGFGVAAILRDRPVEGGLPWIAIIPLIVAIVKARSAARNTEVGRSDDQSGASS